MEHAWLNSLSEDWVSQSPSEPAQYAHLPLSDICKPNRKDVPHYRGASENRPPVPQTIRSKTSLPVAEEDSFHILGERTANEINIRPGPRIPSDLLYEANGSAVSDDFGASDGTVARHTVQRTSRPTGTQSAAYTQAWRRRLVEGRLAYGEQRDLFCSAGNGLQDIFKAPITKLNSPQERSIFPSSPPSYRNLLTPTKIESGAPISRLGDGSISPNPGSKSRQGPRKIHHTTTSIPPSRFEATSPHPAADVVDSRCTDTPSAQYLSDGDQSRSDMSVTKGSSRSDSKLDDFSAIALQRHVTRDGKVAFTPSVKPADLLYKLDKLRIRQLRYENAGEVRQPAESIPSPGQSRTSVALKSVRLRSGHDDSLTGADLVERSFAKRASNTTLTTDISEMLPEDSLQASTPKHIQPVKPNTVAPNSIDRVHANAPIPSVPYPSPQKAAITSVRGRSPLKLFGPYDTFTSQTLMRRISQFEEQVSTISSTISQPSLADHDHSVQTESTVALASDTASHFGTGQLEGFKFTTARSTPPLSDQVEDNNGAVMKSDAKPTLSRCRFHSVYQSPPVDDLDISVPRVRPNSGHNQHSASTRAPVPDEGDSHTRSRPIALRQTPNTSVVGPDAKRPRTSLSKDPTPKRRRTLHRSDLSYMDDTSHNPLEPAQQLHMRMQSAIGVRRKDARPGDGLQFADPTVLALKQVMNPRPSSRNDVPYSQTRPTRGSRTAMHLHSISRSAPADETAYGDGAVLRKPSILTQDFLDEAGKIMAMIRNQVLPHKPGEAGKLHLNTPPPSSDGLIREPISRPLSRQLTPVGQLSMKIARPALQGGLEEYQEASDMTDIIASSLRSLKLARDAICRVKEEEQLVQNEFCTGLLPQETILTTEDFFRSDPPNIRISRNPDVPARTRPAASLGLSGAEYPSHSSTHSRLSIPTGSSGDPESRKTIAPQSISHLIPDQVGAMILDRDKKVWIRKKDDIDPSHPPHNVPPSDESEDDPFASIPDLTVDMTMEMRNLQLLSPGKPGSQTVKPSSEQKDARTPHPSIPLTSVASSPPTPQSTRGTASRTRYQVTQPEQIPRSSLPSGPASEIVEARVEEEVEHEIAIGQDRVARTPSRRRNLTIAFSSPIASVIHGVVATDWDQEKQPEDSLPTKLQPGRLASSDGMQKVGVRNVPKTHLRSVTRSGSRCISVRGSAFRPRTISRIEEHTEESLCEDAAEKDQSFYQPDHHIGKQPNTSQCAGNDVMVERDDGVDMSVVVAGMPLEDVSGIIAQHAGNFSLSTLPDFTLGNNSNSHRSYGFEVSYVVDGRRLVTGAGTKKVLSGPIRELVRALSEVEPMEPYWEDLTELDLSDKRLSSLHALYQFCGRLVTLNASNNTLGQVEGIPGTVRNLRLANNKLTELTSWDHLGNLQYLNISHNQVKSLSGLRHLVHLRSIEADGNNLGSLEGLLQLDGLLSIRARDNDLSEIDFSGSALSRLAELDLRGNRLSRISGFCRLCRLRTLKLQGNAFEFFVPQPEDRMQGLRHLDIRDNRLRMLDVRSLPNIKLLYADGNMISKVTGLSSTRCLDTLSLREQKGSEPLDVSFLSTATDLRKLFLSGNRIGGSTLALSVDFPNLQELGLANCGLEALPAKMGLLMPNVRRLNINFNAIDDLSPLQDMLRLKRLHAAGSRVVWEDALFIMLAAMPCLAQLDVRDTPLTHGFFPPLQQMAAKKKDKEKKNEGNRAGDEGGSDDFVGCLADGFALPDADPDRDQVFDGRLDPKTRLRRRIYFLLTTTFCRRLSKLDGLEIDREKLLVRDEMYDGISDLEIFKIIRRKVRPQGNGTASVKTSDKGTTGDLSQVLMTSDAGNEMGTREIYLSGLAEESPQHEEVVASAVSSSVWAAEDSFA